MLFESFGLISFIGAVIATFHWDLELFPALCLVVAFFCAINLLYLVFLYLVSLVLPEHEDGKNDSAFCRFFVGITIEWIMRWTRVRVSATGLEKLPAEPFVLVCNHLSRFDPMITYVLLKKTKMSFISKKENMEIPIAGRFIRCAGFLPIDRENPLRAMRTIRCAAKMISEKGFSMGIYPEGTRSKTGELLPFKPGAFVAAQKAACPIVVMACRDTDRIGKNLPLHGTHVYLDVIGVIPADTVTAKKADELAEITRDEIASFLKEGKESFGEARSPAL